MEINAPVKACTATGTLLSIIPNLQSEDLIKTALLAAIGAIVSFTMSMTLNFFWKRRRNK